MLDAIDTSMAIILEYSQEYFRPIIVRKIRIFRLGRKNNILIKRQYAPNGIFAEGLMWPHLFPLYASQIFKTISPAHLK